jgi:ppGpp synthetase/RelA/SpoT-type nucleotidyltranferase
MNRVSLNNIWNSEKEMYNHWGNYVMDTIKNKLRLKILDRSLDKFFIIEPSLRLKSNDSLCAKALTRDKQYTHPYTEIEDKVGVRFVVLTLSDIKIICKSIEDKSLWSYSKDKDFLNEQLLKPNVFQYQSIHYVVKNHCECKINNHLIRQLTPCEIQIKTILQHACSELTHDTIYKPKSFNSNQKIKRKCAQTASLLELSDEIFDSIITPFNSFNAKMISITNELSILYNLIVKNQPSLTNLNTYIIDSYSKFISSKFLVSDIKLFFETKYYIGNKIAERAVSSILFAQPCILLIYYLVDSYPNKIPSNWPLLINELEPIYNDLGKQFPSQLN